MRKKKEEKVDKGRQRKGESGRKVVKRRKEKK